MGKMKKCLSMLLSALLICTVVPLAACSSQSTSKNIVISIEYPTSRAFGDQAVTSFRDWFENEYPDATLEMTSSSVTTINNSVKSEFLQNSEPDIFMTSDYDSFVNEGLLADITNLKGVTLFRKSSIRDLERDGLVYALPLGGGKLYGLCYNKALFEQLGIELPSSTETMTGLIERVSKALAEKQSSLRPISSSLLYPTQSSLAVGCTLSEYTQRSAYLQWIVGYSKGQTTFNDPAFQGFLDDADSLLFNSGAIEKEDLSNTYAVATDNFLNGKSLMFIGDINRVCDAFGESHTYGKESIGAMGVPIGVDGVGYVSFMDDMYLCASKNYATDSDRKREIIEGVMNHIVTGDEDTRSVFTFTGEYCSEYREGEAVQLSDDPFFDQVNKALSQNTIAQGVSNVSFSGVLGNALMSWKRGEIKGGKAEVTSLLESYRTTGVDPFAKSTEPIGVSPVTMPYVSDQMRTQETILSDQLADMLRGYFNADFGLVNAGCIRASIPEGPFSEQSINSMLPYTSYVACIDVSGATLKKAIDNAYDVTPLHKAGKFGAISGLRVVARTKEPGYTEYSTKLEAWKKANPNATDAEVQGAMTTIAQEVCATDATALNLEVISLTDEQGNQIQDDKIYRVALSDYMLKGQDNYDVLGVFSDSEKADRSIKVYNRQGELISGTPDEMQKSLEASAETLSDAFITWVREGNQLRSGTDGRIEFQNLVYLE